jgi:hypothetical protein
VQLLYDVMYDMLSLNFQSGHDIIQLHIMHWMLQSCNRGLINKGGGRLPCFSFLHFGP